MTPSLATHDFNKLWSGFKPATLVSYEHMFGLLLAFLVALDLSLPQLTTLHVLAFLEYLLQHGMSVTNITHHITDIRTMLVVYSCDTAVFRDPCSLNL